MAAAAGAPPAGRPLGCFSLVVMSGFLGMTGPFDFIGRKRPQLRFSGLEERAENDRYNKDGKADQGFSHLL